LKGAGDLSAREYLLLHSAYGQYIGEEVNRFIKENDLDFKVQLVASHGHTVFHLPARGMTAQLGDGAAIAAATGLQVVTDLRSLDVALGGQGAPIVPIGEKLLFPGQHYFLNLGGIANISMVAGGNYTAFDVCPACGVLNLLAREKGAAYDDDGHRAASGKIIPTLLDDLNSLDYYGQPFPKSLANEFGLDQVYGMIKASGCNTEDGLCTYVEHISVQVARAIEEQRTTRGAGKEVSGGGEMLVTGGGAHNGFLIRRLREVMEPLGITVMVPDTGLVDYKEALIMALIGLLRMRQEENTLASVTGARRDSIGGALWNGTDA